MVTVGMTKAKYFMFTCEPMSGIKAAQSQWASEPVPPDKLQQRTEELARLIALTPTDLIMLTKRSIIRQFKKWALKLESPLVSICRRYQDSESSRVGA